MKDLSAARPSCPTDPERNKQLVVIVWRPYLHFLFQDNWLAAAQRMEASGLGSGGFIDATAAALAVNRGALLSGWQAIKRAAPNRTIEVDDLLTALESAQQRLQLARAAVDARVAELMAALPPPSLLTDALLDDSSDGYAASQTVAALQGALDATADPQSATPETLAQLSASLSKLVVQSVRSSANATQTGGRQQHPPPQQAAQSVPSLQTQPPQPQQPRLPKYVTLPRRRNVTDSVLDVQDPEQAAPPAAPAAAAIAASNDTALPWDSRDLDAIPSIGAHNYMRVFFIALNVLS